MQNDVASRTNQRDYTIPEVTIPFIKAQRPPLPTEYYLAPATIWFDEKHGGVYFLARAKKDCACWCKIPTIPAWFSFWYVWNYLKTGFRGAL
jgi:hypothetical protein